MRLRLILAAVLAAGLSSVAHAQTARTVSTCGAQSLRVGDSTSLFVDSTGALCSAAGIGGGAGGASSAINTQRTTGIGTTGVLVSPVAADARRTVTNTSGIACELMGSAAAYGTGYPLPAGGSFTFDASGRTTAALYVACASAGGTVAVLSY